MVPHGVVESDEQLARWLCETAPSGRPLLVPVDDVGAVFVQRHAEVLTKAFRYHRVPEGLSEQLSDKATMADLARAAGVPCPTHALPTTSTALEEFLAESPFPVVVKVRDPEIAKSNPGVPGVAIAHSAAEVRDLWRRHVVDGVPNCILQDYIPGGADTVWMINGYVDATSRLRFVATGRKLRQWPTYTGATSLGICERNDRVVELTARLVEHIGYRGILDIGWRFDARDGQYKLLDFNPRIGATFRLFAGDQDTDVLRALYADLVHGAVLDEEVPDGRTWVNDANDRAAALRYIADRHLTFREYRRSLRGVDESVWAAPDDPAPAHAMRKMVIQRLIQHGLNAGRT
jgi:predicted ATP-grasp superfamily ATP-dependent carboligase